jgi:hypothetical protein
MFQLLQLITHHIQLIHWLVHTLLLQLHIHPILDNINLMKQHRILQQQMHIKLQIPIQVQQPPMKQQIILVQLQHIQVKHMFHLRLHILLPQQVMNINQFKQQVMEIVASMI